MVASGSIGEMPGLAYACGNSCILAAAGASSATVVAGYLLFVERRLVECAAFAAVLFVLPGEFVAVGTTRFIRLTFGFIPEFWRGLALIWIEAGYVFPFVATALLGCYVAIGHSRLDAMRELSANRLTNMWIVVRSYWSVILLSWLLGFNLVLAESSRVTLLSVNAFGLGKVYFGNIVASAFSAQGVDVMLFVAAGAPLFLLLAAIAVAESQITAPRPRGIAGLKERA